MKGMFTCAGDVPCHGYMKRFIPIVLLQHPDFRMSCGNPNTEGDTLMARRVKFDGNTKICVKCKETKGSIVIRYAVYCKSCFFSLVQTRFKKSLEPFVNPKPDGPRRKALQATGSLVIGFSGGTCSTALLDLVAKTYFAPQPPATNIVKGGKEHPRNAERRVWKGKPVVCYVEVCGAFLDDKDMTEEIRATIAKYPGAPFEFIPLRLEDSFDPTWWKGLGREMPTDDLRLNITDGDLPFLIDSSLSPSGNSSLTSLKQYLAALPTQTAFFTAVQTITRLLLLHTAASRNASHLLLGTSLTSLSVNLISSIAQGSGFTIVEEIQEEWQPRSPPGISIRVVRPLRDIGMKDCAIWNWWHGLHPVNRPLRQSGGESKAIGTLTRNFICGLETDYPATVSTIARTCGKLTAKEVSDIVCVLCGRPAQRDVQKWKERISIRSYSDTSSLSEEFLPTHFSQNSKLGDVSGISPQSLTPFLCYACHTTLSSRSSRGAAITSLSDSASNTPLPMWVRNNFVPPKDDLRAPSGVKLSREDMQALIKDSLLPDS